MAKRDYYEVLGVDRSVDQDAMKKAYRTMAMKYHPDKNPDDPQSAEKMKEINEAYAVLSNGEKRRLYDAYGHAGLEGLSQEDIFGNVDFSSLFREFGLGGFGFHFGGGLFDNLFGGGDRRPRGPRQGSDLRYDLEVSLEEVVIGAEKTLALSSTEACDMCAGSGAKPGGTADCDQCGGTGQLVKEQRSGYNIFRQISVCGKCRGEGKEIKEPCDGCQGKGFLENAKKITVIIPRGADTGHAIRVNGEGELGEKGALPGDLYVVLGVTQHPMFERHGHDLYVQKEISFVEAALGGKVAVPGMDGDLTLDIPEETQTGSVHRIMSRGMPRLDGQGRGDMYVVVKVVTPRNLSETAKELLRQLAGEEAASKRQDNIGEGAAR